MSWHQKQENILSGVSGDEICLEVKQRDVTQLAETVSEGALQQEVLCEVCYDTMFIPTQYHSLNTSTSPHRNNPCSDFKCCDICFAVFLSKKIDEKEVGSSLKCPGGCGEVLSSSDVRIIHSKNVFVTQDMMNKYEAVLQEVEAIELAKNIRLKSTIPTVSDVLSSVKFHFWSVGKDVKRCGGCHMMIEKDGGCSHMTCQHCKHQFYWCCGRSYSKKHNKVLCFPVKYAYHRSKWWGPILPIRMFTKTVVAGVGLGLGTFAALTGGLGYGALVLAEHVSKVGSVERQRRQVAAFNQRSMELRRERENQEALMKRVQEESNLKDLETLNKLLDAYKPSVVVSSQSSTSSATSAAEEKEEVSSKPCKLKATMDTMAMMQLTSYNYSSLCPLCDLQDSKQHYTTVGELFHHLCDRHISLNDDSVDDDDKDKVIKFMNRFIETHLHRPNKTALYRNGDSLTCSFLVDEQILFNNYKNTTDIKNTTTRCCTSSVVDCTVADTPNNQHQVSQRCPCGLEFDSIANWCHHLSLHSERGVVKIPIVKTGKCLVVIREGYLCPCSHCGESSFCSECNHPRVLHNDHQ